MHSDFLQISPRISVLPVIHGSGDFAVQVRQTMLTGHFDCLAVPLPPSFQASVEEALEILPGVTVVTQLPAGTGFTATEWTPESESPDPTPETPRKVMSFVPLDPCQPVITALRIAVQERIPRYFIDLETAEFQPVTQGLPDAYALKRLAVERFAASVLPMIPQLPNGQPRQRVLRMAQRLRELEGQHERILLVCSILEWPWIKAAYQSADDRLLEDELVEETTTYQVEPRTLLFILGELPYITGLYERARSELDDDENLSLDGIKELLVETRARYKADLKHQAREITPHLLATYFRYVRNLCLIERRMTPDLYTLIVAAQQIAGDQFALHLAELAKEYPFTVPTGMDSIAFGIDHARLPDGEVVQVTNRLPGQPLEWRHCELQRKPSNLEKQRWQMQWNPYSQCSWPPEDVAIENFRTHVKDSALALLGNDLAKSEKFTTSLMDGLDMRETLRNWHTGDLYVKLIPPTRGNLDCVVMLFDSPADPREYPWRITWSAEHTDESTLALFATDFQEHMVGPGIGLSTYGGAMFLFPPRHIPEIWDDPRLDFATTLEERVLAAACLHSQEKHVALLSASPPGIAWKRIAQKYRKKLIHVPLSRFSQATIQQLRLVHVLNGQKVRSYAAEFIRKA
ncbi:MAG: hypothetical protein V4719_19830 [Planctomycetota bacterium]